MYSPKIKEDLIPGLYKIAKVKGIPMTMVVDEFLRPAIEEDASKKLVYLCRNCRSEMEKVGDNGTGFCDYCETPVFIEKALL